MTLGNLLQNTMRFNNELKSGRLIRDIIVENEALIIDMNAEDQLFEHGLTSTGVSIASYAPYQPATIEIKRQKGQPTNRVTLRDTGEFEEAFYVEATNDQFTISSHDEKTDDLVYKYGKEIFGLTAENKNELIHEYIYPSLLETLKKTIYGKSTN